MGTLRLVILFGWAVLASGCMISEQAGQMPQELAFHFDTDFNRAIVFGRVIALVLLVMWVFAKFKKPNAILLSHYRYWSWRDGPWRRISHRSWTTVSKY